ncbi:MAG: NUDIX domain-containing protein [Luteibaculaceae bacterium]
MSSKKELPRKEGNWVTLTEKTVHENNWIRVDAFDVTTPTNTPGHYSVVHFKNVAVGVIPLDKDMNTYIVGQYRYPLKQYSWEIPEGGSPEGTNPETSAARELEEECGLKPQKLTKILEMHLSNSVSDELAIIYVATNLLETEKQPEETEELEIKKVSWNTLVKMVINGEITDSMSVAGVLKLNYLLQNNLIQLDL